MKRKQILFLSFLAIAIVIIAILALWYCAPKTFLKGLEAEEVASISVLDGSTGKQFEIDDPEEIRYIVENIQSREMKRAQISVHHSGFTFHLRFCGKNGAELDSFIINSADTICSNPFFYRCDGGLCFDYLQALEAQYPD